MKQNKYVMTRPYTIKYDGESSQKAIFIDQYVEVPHQCVINNEIFILNQEDMKKITKWGFAREEGCQISFNLNLSIKQDKDQVQQVQSVQDNNQSQQIDQFRKQFQIPCSFNQLEQIANYMHVYKDIDDGDRFLTYLEQKI